MLLFSTAAAVVEDSDGHAGADDDDDADDLEVSHACAEEHYVQNISYRNCEIDEHTGQRAGNELHRVRDTSLHDPKAEANSDDHAHELTFVFGKLTPLLDDRPDRTQEYVRCRVPERDGGKMHCGGGPPIVDDGECASHRTKESEDNADELELEVSPIIDAFLALMRLSLERLDDEDHTAKTEDDGDDVLFPQRLFEHAAGEERNHQRVHEEDRLGLAIGNVVIRQEG